MKRTEYNRKWEAEHHEERKEYRRAQYAKDPRPTIARNKRFYYGHREQVLKRAKDFYAANPDVWLKRYGITSKDFETMLEKQNGACAVCKKKKKLCVDHDHETGKVRGLLCRACNTAIGNLGDSHEGLLNAAQYLTSSSEGFSDVHWLQIQAPV
jgi:hypothetical protein